MGKIYIKKKINIVLFVLFFLVSVIFLNFFYFNNYLIYSIDVIDNNFINNSDKEEKRDFIIEPVLMFFSNSPEYITNNGYLISGYVSNFTPTLIYFYHVNKSEIYKELVIRFYNDKNNEIYIDGLFSSGKNYFKVGSDVNNKMLKNFNPTYLSFENEFIIKIPFKPYDLLSGFIWIFTNNSLNFESFVINTNDVINYRYILKTDNKHVKGIFGVGRILTYLPENQDIIVGDIPLAGIESNMLLKGTYKVMYHFVVNKTGEIYFNPRGGPSRPAFVIYNKFYNIYFTQGSISREYTETKLTNRNYVKEFIVIPEGASYYPVRFLIK